MNRRACPEETTRRLDAAWFAAYLMSRAYRPSSCFSLKQPGQSPSSMNNSSTDCPHNRHGLAATREIYGLALDKSTRRPYYIRESPEKPQAATTW